MALYLKICIVCALLMSHFQAVTQPVGCSAPSPAQSCSGTCMACDGLNGFSGSMIMGGPGQAIPGYCTQVVHNMQYIGFIAGSSAVSIQVTVSGCSSAIGTGGMEAGIYASNDCNNFTLSSNCNTNIPHGSSAVITGAGLTVGECYYLVMDGNGANSCSYSLTVLSGSTQAPMVPNSGIITGPNVVCPGNAYTYQVTPLPCMQSHTWTLNGSPIGMGSSVNVSFPGPGTYQLCAEANAICNNIPPTCRTIVIPPSTPTQVQYPICLGDCIMINGTQYCSPGLYPVTFTASNGCDSVVNYLITQLPFTAPNLVQKQLCANECVVINGDSYCNAGLVPITYASSFGCDSLVNYLISSVPPIITSQLAEICQGQTYAFNGQSLSVSGSYLDTLQSTLTGCDSIILLSLSVTPSANTNISENLCSGQTFLFGSQILSTSGTYTQTFLAASCCDSIVTLNLDISPPSTANFSTQICQGQTFQFGTQILNTSGIYQRTIPAANGCDSVITLTLSVTPSANAQISETICSGQSLMFGNQNLTTSGTYTRTITSSAGCDSIITLNLSVVPALTETVNAQICNGQTYAFGTQSLTTSGTYTRTVTSSAGCDSIITLNLSVVPALTTTITDQICNGQTYAFGTQNLTTSGTYTRTVTSSAGCDSIITLNLSVVPALTETVTAQICNGQTYAFGTQSLTTSGTYTRTVTSSAGCDSIITLNLNVVPTVTGSVTAQICNGQTYAFGTQSLTTSGTYTRTVTSSAGCDSIITLNLSVAPALTETISAQICNGQTYVFGTQSLTTSGTYTRTVISSAGCDSIITLTLSVVPALTGTVSAQICNGQTYAFGTQSLTTSGTYTRTVSSSGGCDSIITFNLSVVPVLTATITDQICNGQTYAFGTQNLTTSGTYTRTVISSAGCDSMITLTLSVVPALTATITDQICNGQTYAFGTQSLTTSGTYTRTVTSSAGCDSIITLNLSVVPALTETVSVQICNGQTYAFGTQNLTTSGTYTRTVSSSAGCDSMITLNLSVVPALTGTVNAQICNGQTYAFGTQSLTTSGTYTRTVTSSAGCDSMITLNLSVVPALTGTVSAQICNGQTYAFGTQSLTTSGTYTRTVSSSGGCDSIITLNLSVVPVLTATITDQICNGQTYAFGTQNLTASGTYTRTVTSSAGCDSMITLTLSVVPVLTGMVSAQICNGLSYNFEPQNLTTSGTYTQMVTASTGCDSLITLNLSVESVITTSIAAEICSGQSYLFGTETLTNPGLYTDTLQALGGCDSIVALNLSVLPPIQLDLGPDVEVQKGQMVQLNVVSSAVLNSIQWEPANLVACATCLTTETVPLFEDATLIFSATSDDGCDAAQTLLIRVKESPAFYVPNVLRTGSAANGSFTIYSNGAIEQINLLRIYDRWGNAVFEAKDFPDSAPQYGWDGSFKKEKLNPGVFVWYAELLLKNGEVVLEKGDVTIIR
jgi:hypothetical protein